MAATRWRSAAPCRRPTPAAARCSRIRLVGLDVLVDGRLDQGMRERDVPDVDLVGALEQTRPRPLPRRRPPDRRAGQRRGHRQGGSDTQHRTGLDERSGRRAAGRQPTHDLGDEGTRRREPRLARCATGRPGARTATPARTADCRRCGRAAAGRSAGGTAAHRAPSPASGCRCSRAPPGGPAVPWCRSPAGGDRRAARSASSSRAVEEGQDASAHEPAEREEQRPERVDVRPVSVVDQQDRPDDCRSSFSSVSRSTAPTPTGSSGGSARCLPASRSPPRTPAAREQLIDHPEGDERLPLLAARAKEATAPSSSERNCSIKEVLPIPAAPGQQDRLRPTRTDLGQDPSEHGELDGPADERIQVLRHRHVLIFGYRVLIEHGVPRRSSAPSWAGLLSRCSRAGTGTAVRAGRKPGTTGGT